MGSFLRRVPRPVILLASVVVTALLLAGIASGGVPTDTAPPVVTITITSDPVADGHGDAILTYDVSAIDNTDPAPTIDCGASPPSGSEVHVNTTVTITCTATDSAGNVGSGTETFTAQAPPDHTSPVVTITITSDTFADGPGGAILTYTVSAIDALDPTPTIDCGTSPASGAQVAVGATVTISCTATDESGNEGSDTETFTARPRPDTTPPVVTITITSDGIADGPGGAILTYSVAATDDTDPSPTLDCGASPASGTTVLVGTTVTITCDATDAAGNTGTDTEAFTAQDVGAPVVTVPASRTVEANGPGGAIVNYATPTAVDLVDGPLLATCSKPSGSVFPLGVTVVTCSATDSGGRTGSASFTVTVVDTTAPVLTVPADISIQSSSAVPASNSTIQDFLGGATASDIVDQSVSISHNAPASFPLGTTTVVFRAEDDAGNATEKSAVVTVTTQPAAPPTSTDTTPPDNVRAVKAIAGNLSVAIRWRAPQAQDFHHVTITRSPGLKGAPQTVVYSGKKKTFLARGLQDGVEYRFVIVAHDEAGNRAAGVAVVVFAERQNLLVPVNGATINPPRRFAWKPIQGADYYNAQFWHNGKKLSVWPLKPSFMLKGSWRFEGKQHRLVPGTWQVYIWPGFGKKAQADYGELHVEATFVVRRG